MQTKFHVLVVLAILIVAVSSGCGGSQRKENGGWAHHPDLETAYTPWGIDEYELYGLTKEELKQKFERNLHFNYDYSEAVFYGGKNPRFELTFDNDKKVATIQRIFIDGDGCHLKGPVLKSKQAALEFAVDGLLKISKLTEKEQLNLAIARKSLADLRQRPQ